MILEAIDRSGSFIDVGCANGHLMEMLDRWLEGTEIRITFYGLDISEELIHLAKKRLPNWKGSFFIGNALYWTPPKKYDFVCTRELGYVPRKREKEFLERLFVDYLKEGGRLILGPYTEERRKPELEEKLNAWGWSPSGYCEKSHQKHQVLSRRLLWFDKGVGRRSSGN
jgi:trans-aconitate methyltransferase